MTLSSLTRSVPVAAMVLLALVGVGVLGLGLAGISLAAVPISIVWLVNGLWLGRRNEVLARDPVRSH